ncbi:MAG: 5-(carboxyamino)imidazole ribonucleotide synthase [Psychroflexus sp.]|nr:5-(carboxyamino)imidazole ribonucleotide synthase [Psychroflexus sp.]MDR9448414.1 5-(carboxyamino)imidazole ribonucleotide synthase [Psychroflexus sp.]
MEDKNYFSSSFILGILGGGQLGKMLLYETRKWDIKTHVLDPNDEAPSRISCDYFQKGDLLHYETVYNFGLKADVITIEIEAVNVQALADLQKKGKKIFPQPDVLKIIQNKITQKQFYKQHHLPTADFNSYQTKTDLQNAISQDDLSFPFVWKSATGGYDGMGVEIIKNKSEVEKLPDNPCLAENKVDFTHELSVIVARNSDGEVKTYPVVEMEFHPAANQVEYVITPARVESHIHREAKQLAKNTADQLQIVGLLAVELFLTKDDKLLINEVAPRPHNSGHVSIEASYTNQFEQYLRAVLNLPLGSTDNKVSAVMVNLVGSKEYTGYPRYKNIDQLLKMDGVTPHIYGKKQTRPFRKMGHVNIIDADVDKARKKAEEVKSKISVISHVKS